jgi:hypothetical protein
MLVKQVQLYCPWKLHMPQNWSNQNIQLQEKIMPAYERAHGVRATLLF